MQKLALASLCLALLFTSQGEAADLAVTVKNVAMKNGHAEGAVYVCLYPASAGANADFPSCEIDGVKKVKVEGIQNGIGKITFAGLSDGTYALSAFQDTNGNAKLDMGMVLPTERAATYKPACRKPTFAEIAFAVPAVSGPVIELIDFGFWGILTCHT
jgi:uncharacterized protein (DUF2141 family)